MSNNLVRTILLVIAVCSPCAVWGAEFIATIENNHINLGQSIQLKLELVDAKASNSLDISSLAQDFTIYQQQQYSSYSSTNGHVRAESGWQVILMPKHTGELIIPGISIATDHGILSTQPIKLQVDDAKSGSATDKDNIGISIVASVNKAKAYVNEPVIYTLKIISYKPIANVVLDDIKSNDALIEKLGDPKQYDQNYGGMRAHIIEIRYAITAMKSGQITIAPAMMSGELQIPNPKARQQRFGMFNSIMFDNMYELKPFRMQTEEITINVLAPIGKTQDWLPLKKFTLTQSIDVPRDLKVGDTITRKIKMVGTGGFAKQLPNTKDMMQIDNAKIYANKPNFSDNFTADIGTIIGTKEEEYSIVPQASGSITLPEIQIKWWNLKTNKFETSSIPSQTIKVAPLAASANQNVTLDFSNTDVSKIEEPQVSTTRFSTVLYVVVGIVVGMLCTLAVGILLIFIKRRGQPKIKPVTSKKTPPTTTISTVADVRTDIMEHAVKHWQMQKDTPFNLLGVVLQANNYVYDLELYKGLMQDINAALYADMEIDLTEIVEHWEKFKVSVVKSKHAQKNPQEDYSTLNPT